MPAALRARYLAAREEGGKGYRFERGAFGGARGRNEAQSFDVALSDGALGVSGRGWHAGLRWTGVGRGSQMAAVERPEGGAEVVGRRAVYRRGDGSEESYENGPLGVEQEFILARRPAGANDEAVAVEVTIEGDLTPELSGCGRIDLQDEQGATVARSWRGT
jgi:hypothetical protein